MLNCFKERQYLSDQLGNGWAVQTSLMAGFDKIISFDMGGTSTDVAHYNGEYERTFETEIAGVRLRTPMMAIHTVAAGGGSILQFDGSRYRWDRVSWGESGPASYSQSLDGDGLQCDGGQVTASFFPKVFGQMEICRWMPLVHQSLPPCKVGIIGHQEQVASGFPASQSKKMR